MLQRSDVSPGKWCFPGGKVDAYKDSIRRAGLVEALQRELREEVDHDIAGERIGPWYQPSKGYVKSGYAPFFAHVEGTYSPSHVSLDVGGENDHRRFSFTDQLALEDVAFPSHKTMYGVVTGRSTQQLYNPAFPMG